MNGPPSRFVTTSLIAPHSALQKQELAAFVDQYALLHCWYNTTTIDNFLPTKINTFKFWFKYIYAWEVYLSDLIEPHSTTKVQNPRNQGRGDWFGHSLVETPSNPVKEVDASDYESEPKDSACGGKRRKGRKSKCSSGSHSGRSSLLTWWHSARTRSQGQPCRCCQWRTWCGQWRCHGPTGKGAWYHWRRRTAHQSRGRTWPRWKSHTSLLVSNVPGVLPWTSSRNIPRRQAFGYTARPSQRRHTQCPRCWWALQGYGSAAHLVVHDGNEMPKFWWKWKLLPLKTPQPSDGNGMLIGIWAMAFSCERAKSELKS